MRSTPEEIRRRIAKRKRSSGSPSKESNRLVTWPGDEEKYGFNHTPSYETKFDDEGNHPLFKKEVFIFKILASSLLFLVIAILFRNNSAAFDPARDFVAKSMDNDFKFATVANWYEENFGKPLALLPFPAEDKENEKAVVDKEGSIPVFSGKVLENFEKDGQGIMIETGNGASVEVMNEGFVKFAGVKEGLRKNRYY